jgi:hypothetical protein
MVNDITLLYYTSNRIHESFANKVRDHLVNISGKDLPVISVSFKPLNFGNNIYTNWETPSFYNLYKQILIGCRCIKTEYVACCEDDCLYTYEHFAHRPPANTFSYNMNRWNIDKDVYYYRQRFGMCTCIAPTKLLLDTLERRYTQYPVEFPQGDKLRALLEPGKYQEFSDFPPVNVEFFKTEPPPLTFNHRPSLGGVRKLTNKDKIEKILPYWGSALDLRKEFYG